MRASGILTVRRKPKDGLDGDNGTSGCIYRPNKGFTVGQVYRNDDGVTNVADLENENVRYIDIVLIENPSLASGAECYIAKKEGTLNYWLGTESNSPTIEEFIGDESLHWTRANSLAPTFTNLLVTNIALIDFAKIASAVFKGDHMFSQYGKDVNGDETNEYGLFDPAKIGQVDAPFTPNVLVDWLNGTMRLLKLIADGAELTNVKGLTGEFKSLQSVDSLGNVKSKIYFDETTNSMTFNGDIYHQNTNGNDYRFFANKLFCRGEFGHRVMTTLVFDFATNPDVFAHLYASGTDTTYHKYGGAGKPVDCVVLRGTGTYVLYVCDAQQYKSITVVNESNSPKWVIYNYPSRLYVVIDPWKSVHFVVSNSEFVYDPNVNNYYACNLFVAQ